MLNCVTLIGRLTADPVLKSTITGKDVCSFVIAVDRSYVATGEKKSDFITIVAWEAVARFVTNYFSKGQMIALQGSIQSRGYDDKKGGRRTAFEVVAREASFCGNKAEGGKKNNLQEKPDLTGSGYFSNASAEDFEEIVDEEEYG